MKRMDNLKKQFAMGLLIIISLTACNPKETYTYWTERTDNQIQRLNEGKIKYEIRDGAIWVRDKDLKKAMACCS